MANSTLLQLVQAVETELGLPVTSYVIAAPDATSKQLARSPPAPGST